MSVKKPEQRLWRYSAKVYTFIHALIPDELVAQKILIEVCQIFFVEEREFIGRFTEQPLAARDLYIKKYLYKKAFALSKRAAGKIQFNREFTKNYLEFYQLSIDKRAVLFLKHKTDMDYDALEEILGVFRHEIICHLFDAREKIVDYMGERPLSGD